MQGNWRRGFLNASPPTVTTVSSSASSSSLSPATPHASSSSSSSTATLDASSSAAVASSTTTTTSSTERKQEQKRSGAANAADNALYLTPMHLLLGNTTLVQAVLSRINNEPVLTKYLSGRVYVTYSGKSRVKPQPNTPVMQPGVIFIGTTAMADHRNHAFFRLWLDVLSW